MNTPSLEPITLTESDLPAIARLAQLTEQIKQNGATDNCDRAERPSA